MLYSLVVAAAWRRRGLGSTLLQLLEGHARSIGCRWLYLCTVEPENLAFYKSCGYQVFASPLLSTNIHSTLGRATANAPAVRVVHMRRDIAL